MLLRHRLTTALGPDIPGVPHMEAPYEVQDILSQGASRNAASVAPNSQAHYSQGEYIPGNRMHTVSIWTF